ncbi:GrpB family protein [Brevibacillus sp. SAFN-007a]|uniref:GrpB family protein n=1 Tax=Brevibacillus sp. SAFN-007a TaxID=3436862 RepID=UPI003F7DD562
MRKVEVCPYDPRWQALFAAEAELLRQVFRDNLIHIHHIGSTAVPGLKAKPIIDLLPAMSQASMSWSSHWSERRWPGKRVAPTSVHEKYAGRLWGDRSDSSLIASNGSTRCWADGKGSKTSMPTSPQPALSSGCQTPGLLPVPFIPLPVPLDSGWRFPYSSCFVSMDSPSTCLRLISFRFFRFSFVSNTMSMS